MSLSAMFCEVWGPRSGHCLFQHPHLHTCSWLNQAHMHRAVFSALSLLVSEKLFKSDQQRFESYVWLSTGRQRGPISWFNLNPDSTAAMARGTCQAPLFQPLLPPKDPINTTHWAWLVLCSGCQRNNHTLTAYSAFGSSCVLLPFPCSALHCNSLAFWPLPLTFLLSSRSAWYNCIQFPVLWLGFWSQFLPRCLPCISLLFYCLTLTCLALAVDWALHPTLARSQLRYWLLVKVPKEDKFPSYSSSFFLIR